MAVDRLLRKLGGGEKWTDFWIIFGSNTSLDKKKKKAVFSYNHLFSLKLKKNIKKLGKKFYCILLDQLLKIEGKEK